MNELERANWILGELKALHEKAPEYQRAGLAQSISFVSGVISAIEESDKGNG